MAFLGIVYSCPYRSVKWTYNSEIKSPQEGFKFQTYDKSHI